MFYTYSINRCLISGSVPEQVNHEQHRCYEQQQMDQVTHEVKDEAEQPDCHYESNESPQHKMYHLSPLGCLTLFYPCGDGIKRLLPDIAKLGVT